MSDQATNDRAGRTTDPYGVIPDDAFPRSYQEYRVTAPFLVMAHSEEQARQRWQFFTEALGHLFANEWGPQALVTFVVPESLSNPGAESKLEHVAEHTIDDPRELAPSMGTGTLAEWAWLNPEHDADWEAQELAEALMINDEDDDAENDALADYDQYDDELDVPEDRSAGRGRRA